MKISLDNYNKLKAMKASNETFDDLIEKLLVPEKVKAADDFRKEYYKRISINLE